MTETRRYPPSQKALPVAAWSKSDREAWHAAQEKVGILDDGGIASHLSSRTLKDLTSRYAYFLFFLVSIGRFNQHGPAAAALSEENILLYVHYLEPRVSSVTLAQSLYKIARVAVCLAPQRDWRWLKRLARRLDRRATPRDKRHEVVEIKELCELGRELMNEAEETPASLSIAELYRDGLSIALLATDPLRLANITALEIGRTLIKDGATWSLEIPAEEAKERRLHLAVLPDWCSPCIDRYVHHYRTLFPNAGSTSRLWLTRYGQPLSANGLYRRICKRTRTAFGKRINPHLFRSCLATSTAVHHGANIGLAMTVLHHQSLKVTGRHYNQAKMIDAVRAYQEILLSET